MNCRANQEAHIWCRVITIAVGTISEDYIKMLQFLRGDEGTNDRVGGGIVYLRYWTVLAVLREGGISSSFWYNGTSETTHKNNQFVFVSPKCYLIFSELSNAFLFSTVSLSADQEILSDPQLFIEILAYIEPPLSVGEDII